MYGYAWLDFALFALIVRRGEVGMPDATVIFPSPLSAHGHDLRTASLYRFSKKSIRGVRESKESKVPETPENDVVTRSYTKT